MPNLNRDDLYLAQFDANGAVRTSTAAPAGTADGVGAAGVQEQGLAVYNGATYDRQRSNLSVNALPSAAYTVSQTVANILNVNGMAVDVVLNLTALTGTTPSVTLAINGKTASGVSYSLLTSAALTATGQVVLSLGPGLATTANVSANRFLPRLFDLVVTIAGTTPSATFTLDYNIAE